MPPGMGKSSCVAAAIKLLLKTNTVTRVLIIAPLRVVHNVWPQELAKWSDFSKLDYTILHGDDKRDLALNDAAPIHLMNPEGLSMFVDKKLTKYIGRDGKPKEREEYLLRPEFRKDKFPYDMLVVDESTLFKHSDTDRFKRIKQMLSYFKRRVILTGTPAPNGLLDLFGQIYLLDGGRALGAYITHYRNKWFYPSGYGGYTWMPKAEATEQIHDAIRPYILSLKAEDYLELPPLVRTNVYVDLPAKAAKAYNELEGDLITKLERNLVVAKNAAVASAKCRQVASGGVYVSDEHGNTTKRVEYLHDEKCKAVAEIIDELSGKPALVLYEFDHEREALIKTLGRNTQYIKGGMTTKQTAGVLAKWNAGELSYLLAQTAAVAHGLNLQATGRAVIYFNITWNLEYYEQALKRIWRQGQQHRTFLYHVIARNTIDEIIVNQTLEGKAKTQNALNS